MITSFEVGAIFKVLDEASPTLKRVLAQLRELNKAIEAAKVNMSGIAKMPAPAQPEFGWQDAGADHCGGVLHLRHAGAGGGWPGPVLLRRPQLPST
jgi:hypothetical protein